MYMVIPIKLVWMSVSERYKGEGRQRRGGALPYLSGVEKNYIFCKFLLFLSVTTRGEIFPHFLLLWHPYKKCKQWVSPGQEAADGDKNIFRILTLPHFSKNRFLFLSVSPEERFPATSCPDGKWNLTTQYKADRDSNPSTLHPKGHNNSWMFFFLCLVLCRVWKGYNLCLVFIAVCVPLGRVIPSICLVDQKLIRDPTF